MDVHGMRIETLVQYDTVVRYRIHAFLGGLGAEWVGHPLLLQ